ncbi:hypothetical protein ACM66B_005047 [Microbotryomycetes sp. NB124-2]
MARAPSPDGSPEVDFGAFRRSQSRAGNYQPASSSGVSRPSFANGYSNPAAATSSQAKTTTVSSTQSQSSVNARPIVVATSSQTTTASANRTKSRQGAPRLGGLGLGGIHSTSSSSPNTIPTAPKQSDLTARATKANETASASPTRPLNVQRRSSSNRKPAPSPTVDDLKAAAPNVGAGSSGGSNRKEGQTEKAFLYPEVGKPTMRTGAFVLERPVPDVMQQQQQQQQQQTSTTQQLPSPPESPAEEPTEDFFGRSAPTTPSKEDEGVAWARRPSLDSRNSDGSPNRKRMGMVDRMLVSGGGGTGDRTSGHTDSDTLEVLDQKLRDNDTESTASLASFESAQDDTGGEEITFGSPAQQQHMQQGGAAAAGESPASVYEERHEPMAPNSLALQTDSSDSATSAVEPQTPEQTHTPSKFDDDGFGTTRSKRNSTPLEDLLNERARAGYSIPQHADINGYYSDDEPRPSGGVARSDRSASFLDTDPAETGLVPDLPPPVGMSRSSSGRSLVSSSSRSKSPVPPPRPSRARRPPGHSSSNPTSPALSSSEFSGAEDNGFVSSSDERERGANAPVDPQQPRSMMETIAPTPPAAAERPSLNSRVPSSTSTLLAHNSRPQALLYASQATERANGDDTITPTLSRHTSYTKSPVTTPTLNSPNTYEGLGLRLPSSLRGPGGKRNSIRATSSSSAATSPSSPPPVLSPLLPTSTSSSTLTGTFKEEVESPTGSIATTTSSNGASGPPHVPNIVAHVTQLRRMSMDKDASPVERLADKASREQSPTKATTRESGDENTNMVKTRRLGESSEKFEEETSQALKDEQQPESESLRASTIAQSQQSGQSTPNLPNATEQVTTAVVDTNSNNDHQRRGSTSSTGSGGGGVADIGVAAVGAIVTGGMAVGWAAWRGLSAAASFGLGRGSAGAESSVRASEETEVIQAESKSEDGAESDRTPNMGALPGRFDIADQQQKDDDEDSDGGDAAFEDATGSPDPIHTEWGDVEFEAPKGFLEAFQKAMEEIGPEDEAANREQEEQAANAAYESALQLHAETEALERAFRKPIRMRDGIVPERPQSPRGEDDGDDDGEHHGEAYEELMDLVSPMFDAKNAKDAKYAPPPGLTGVGGQSLSRSFSQQSSASSNSSKVARGSPNPALKASLSPQMPKSRSLFGFGGGSGHERRSSIGSDKSPPPSYTSQRAKSVASLGSDNDDPTSITSGNSKLTRKTKTRSIFGVRKSSSPVDMPSIESQISDMTYVSYSSGRAAKRKSSLSSSKTTQSGDTLLSPISTTSNLSFDSTGSSTKSPSPLGLGPGPNGGGRPRKPSLRKVSRYDHDSPSPPPPSKLYRVRFGNASKGIGLRSVAEDEAERAGGEEHAIRWVGVGRGNRYGNLLIQTDDSTDEKYAVQVNDIKKKWRVRNSKGYNRDWTTVRID